jgi:hypothetical protein
VGAHGAALLLPAAAGGLVAHQLVSGRLHLVERWAEAEEGKHRTASWLELFVGLAFVLLSANSRVDWATT